MLQHLQHPKFPLDWARIRGFTHSSHCQLGWALFVPAAVPWDGAEGQEPLFGNGESPQGHPVPVPPTWGWSHFVPPSSEATPCLCHPPRDTVSLCHPAHPEVPVSPTLGCGRLLLLQWPPKKIHLGLWEAKKAGMELALEQGQKQGRMDPGQGSATPRLFPAEQEPNANRAGRAWECKRIQIWGERKYKAQVGFYSQERAGS